MKHRPRITLNFGVALTLAVLPASLFASSPSESTNTDSSTAFDPDNSIHPCDDLYGFVNNRWLAANAIPSDRTSWGTFEMLGDRSEKAQLTILESLDKGSQASGSIEQIVGDFYASGMDEKRINGTPIATQLKPLLDPIDAIRTSADIASFIDANYAKAQVDVFGFGGQADFKNSTMNIGYAGVGGLNLQERTFYLSDRYMPIRKAYIGHLEKNFKLAGFSDADAKQQAEWTMAIETRLATASLSPIEARDTANQYKMLSVAEADKITPHFAWEKFFDGVGVKDVKGFSLAETKFFTEFDKMLTDVPVQQWQAYFRAHAIDGTARFLNDALSAEHFAFYNQTLRGQRQDKPRWKLVLTAINSEAGEALGELYVRTQLKPGDKERVKEMIGRIHDAFKPHILGRAWLSDTARSAATEKWSSLEVKVGYPDKWREWNGLKINRDDYLGNVLAANEFNTRWQLGKIGKPVDRTEWGMTPQTVNAYYNPLQNEIVFPAAILQPPFFDSKADDAVNYGGIGTTIGQVMAHAYDEQGAQFDANGNQRSWWTAADWKAYNEVTRKLVQQFDEYVAIKDTPAGPIHVRGELTRDENLADLGGLIVAYDALQRALGEKRQADPMVGGYTLNQRFFMGWARTWRRNMTPHELLIRLNTDPHAPPKFRAIGAPSNMPAFAQAFTCKAGDAMVRGGDKQVVIW